VENGFRLLGVNSVEEVGQVKVKLRFFGLKSSGALKKNDYQVLMKMLFSYFR
jgi:hypothetical protein